MEQHAGEKQRDNSEEGRPERVQHRYVDELEHANSALDRPAGVEERAAATSVL